MNTIPRIHSDAGKRKPRCRFDYTAMIVVSMLGLPRLLEAATTELRSPDGRNVIQVITSEETEGVPRYVVSRDGQEIIRSSAILPVLAEGVAIKSRMIDVSRGEVNEQFPFEFGKNSQIVNRCRYGVVTLRTQLNLTWEIELRAYDDGVAFRYRFPKQDARQHLEIQDEWTQFDIAGHPNALFNTLSSFTTSHESPYSRKAFSDVPSGTLIDMPLLLVWPEKCAAAITEARVRSFSNACLERPSADKTMLRCRLSPAANRKNISVASDLPCESPWRVVLLGDVAGELLESDLLLCLNDAPVGDYQWLRPGKTTWHWWNGAFEKDHELPQESTVSLDRHKRYIDFCADNNIAYHAVSGDGLAWYRQSKQPGKGYGKPAADADVTRARDEIQLPKILDYAKQRGVGIRLWVHWKPLSEQLEDAFTLYESWGVKGLMVDFLNRDDQEMVEFIERMLLTAR